MLSQKMIRQRIARSNVLQPPHTFYKAHDLYKFDNKNVVYMAYVGNIDGEDIFKYGKTSKLYDREFKAHRKTFDRFDMHTVKITDNKDIVEEIFEKELLIRNIHRTITINSKRQTELFTTSGEYNLEYVTNLLTRIVKDNPSYEVLMYKRKLEKLQAIINMMI